MIFHDLDLFAASLSERSLIEASAGTGKTWTITGLYVRLLLETDLAVDNILVVTYTKAATAELRDRIRRRLGEVVAALESGRSEDPFCSGLLAVHDTESERERLAGRLSRALQRFDEAAIFTIHGFCQRVLAESAFATGADFGATLISDESDLVQEAVADFWRRETATLDDPLLEYLIARKYSPDRIRRDLAGVLGQVHLPVDPLPDVAVTEGIAAWREAWAALKGLWLTERAAVVRDLESGRLNGNSYRAREIPGWLDQMDALLSADNPPVILFDKFEKFTQSALVAATRKGQQPPVNPFYEAAEVFMALGQDFFPAWLAGLRQRALQEVRQSLRRRKLERRLMSFDDLIGSLEAAIAQDTGGDLRARLAKRYRAALIDEFQDTDPVQYRIFDGLFDRTDLPVFFVGDPKQAIYSFRGADVHAYLHARQAATRHYTLTTNQRSDKPLLDAIASLFQRNPNPFWLPDIRFVPVAESHRKRPALVDKERGAAALNLWWLPAEKGVLQKGEATRRATAIVASEIARLLRQAAAGTLLLGDRRLEAGDIAILVPGHRLGRQMREALTARNIPCVQQGQDNVWSTEEAAELVLLLGACLTPTDESRIRAALSTRAVGRGASEILALMENEREWDRILEGFVSYHDLWAGAGFMRMMRQMMQEQEIPRRLLALPDGERRLTNWLHLVELVQEKAAQSRLVMGALLDWVSSRRHPGGADEADGALLRLESDDKRVQIVTVHASKGLEYPVVFCPYLWDGNLRAGSEAVTRYHDPASGQIRVDLGSPNQGSARVQAERDEYAEKLRLLYVALTRARHRIYLTWGPVKSLEQAAATWLLHPPADACRDDWQESWGRQLKALGGEGMRAALAAWAAGSQGCVRMTDAPEETGLAYTASETESATLHLRTLERSVRPAWRVGSFSVLSAGISEEGADRDAVPAPAAPVGPAPGLDRFSFPRGARAGSCWHSIFEHLDFKENDGGRISALVGEKLAEYGFDAVWQEPVVAMITDALAAPLGNGVHLGAVPRHDRLDELEILYPVRRLDTPGLRRVIEAHAPGSCYARWAAEIRFDSLEGYLKGFVDLVYRHGGRYYVADYKSNWLGGDMQAYHREALDEAMRRDHYWLQGLIYAVALHRHLGVRMPRYAYDRHFGGIQYLFLRGMDAAGQYGIWADCPSRSLVEGLDRWLLTGEAP